MVSEERVMPKEFESFRPHQKLRKTYDSVEKIVKFLRKFAIARIILHGGYDDMPSLFFGTQPAVYIYFL